MVSSEWRMVGCKPFHSLLAIRYSPYFTIPTSRK
jgi:hypothetical protein